MPVTALRWARPITHDTRTSVLAFWKHYLVAATLLLVAARCYPDRWP